MICFL
jgi:hypothetical protein